MLLNNKIGAKAENRLILLTNMRDKHPKGEYQIGVNIRVEENPFGGREYTKERVGMIYWNPVHKKIMTLEQYHTDLAKFKYKKKVPIQKVTSFFPAAKSDGVSPTGKESSPKKFDNDDIIQEKLDEFLCEEQLESVLSDNNPSFLNSILSDSNHDEKFNFKQVDTMKFKLMKQKNKKRK